jgi:hypothetical protein
MRAGCQFQNRYPKQAPASKRATNAGAPMLPMAGNGKIADRHRSASGCRDAINAVDEIGEVDHPQPRHPNGEALDLEGQSRGQTHRVWYQRKRSRHGERLDQQSGQRPDRPILIGERDQGEPADAGRNRYRFERRRDQQGTKPEDRRDDGDATDIRRRRGMHRAVVGV